MLEIPTNKSGFSLMEVIIAILMLVLIVAVILNPMSSMFKTNRDSNKILTLITISQQYLENTRGSMVTSTANYDNFSLNTYAQSNPLPAGVTMTCVDMNAQLAAFNSSNLSCTTSSPLKRLTIKESGGAFTLIMDVPRP